jgi:hypothetical protein
VKEKLGNLIYFKKKKKRLNGLVTPPVGNQFRERESSAAGGRRRLLYSFVSGIGNRVMAKKEGGVFCLKNCYQLLLLHHHAKGATCAFQFLTAAIVDNPKGEREGGGREEIIDTQWHQRTVKREKKANETHWHYYTYKVERQ